MHANIVLILNLQLFFVNIGISDCQVLLDPEELTEEVLRPRVYKGTPAKIGEVPYQVAFKARDGYDRSRFYTFCGGAILREDKILSAAHCFVAEREGCIAYFTSQSFVLPLKDKFAVAATLRNLAYTIEDYEQWRRLWNITYPADFQFPHNDIAILFVRKPFIFNGYVKPIAYSMKYVDYNGLCLVSGYGKISYYVDSDSLQTAYLRLIPHYFCSYSHNRDMRHFICTSTLLTDVGRGDSGGPLVCAGNSTNSSMDVQENGILVGIVSGTTPGANSFFTRVSSFRDFIEGNRVADPLPEQEPVVLSQAIVPRVVNGWPAQKGDVPYQIAFKSLYSRYHNQFVTFCGGTIISPTKLLSAAHCFDVKKSACQKCWGTSVKVSKRQLSEMFAVAGNLQNVAKYHSRDSIEEGQWRRLREVIYPRHFHFPKHDIAIAFTIRQFVFDTNVSPIPISTKFADYSGQCLVSGYGRTSATHHSDKLLLAHLDLIPWLACNSIHRRNMRHFVCTSSRVADVQKGDSGGPLVCQGTGDPNEKDKGILVGIVSGNRQRAGSFFTRVSSYISYIESKSLQAKIDRSLQFFILLRLYYYWFLLF